MKVEYSKMASVGIPLSEFRELCRLCGSKTSVLMGLHIFEREGDLRQIYKKITACLPVQVHNTDKLPKMVCEECVYNLDALFDFRERSMKTEYELNSMLKEVYQPVCGESMQSIQMDPLICDSPTTTNGLQVQTTVEVEVNLDASGQRLEDIVIARIKDATDPNVKCEPELVLEVETTQSSQQSIERHRVVQRSDTHRQPKETAHFSDGVIVAEIGIDSEVDPLVSSEVHQGGVGDDCAIADAIDANLEVQHMGTLETIEGDIKAAEVASNDTYLVHAQETTVATTTDPEPWFFCNICGKPFDSSHEFQAHCEIHWKKCPECGITCSNDQVLSDHVRESHPPPPQPPPKSGEEKVIKSLDEEKVIKSLDEEVKKETTTAGDPKSCSECGKTYRTNYKLAEHMRKHTGEKPFKCTMCEKAFRSKIGLAQHEAKHTGQFDYTCSTCGKGFQCKSYLVVHQRVHSDLKPYPCDTCGRHFKSKQSLLDHQNRHLGVKPYQCEICGRCFITKGLCKSHQKVHSGLDNRQYPCSVCNKLFVSKSYLATHLRIHTGEKPFMCEVCGKGFLTRVDLRIHSTMHTGEKSFVCEVCGKAFARRDALRCHKRSHTGERPYRCDICGQGFTQFSPMAIHKRLHTGERPYSCDVCSKTFVSRSTMMSHKKKHVS